MKAKANRGSQECSTCVNAKHAKSPTNWRLITSKSAVTVHVDICSTMRVQSLGGKRCFIMMTTEQHRYPWMQMLAHKHEALEEVMVSIAWLKRNGRNLLHEFMRIIRSSFLLWKRH